MTLTGEKITYQWACPYCGASGESRGYEEVTVHNRAKAALRGHVHASEGAGHGPKQTAPEDFYPIDKHLDRSTE